MQYSVVFFITLTIFTFVSFILLNKSQMQMSEKLTSKILIVSLFGLVVIMNEIQANSIQKPSNTLEGVFNQLDLIPLPEEGVQDLQQQFNKTKGIYWINNENKNLPTILHFHFQTNQKGIVHLNFDHYSALNLDKNYLDTKMNQLQTELQNQQDALLIIKLETINQLFLEKLEIIFDQCQCSFIFYGSKVKNIKSLFPQFFRYAQQLNL